MTRELRTITLALLTLVIYALINFIQHGAFVFPTPLNPVLFGIISLYLGVLHFKPFKYSFTVLALGFTALLSSSFIQEIILPAEKMHAFYDSMAPDLIKICHSFILVLFAFLQLNKQNLKLAKIMMALFMISYVSIIIFNKEQYLIVAYGFGLISSQLDKRLSPYHLLWNLLVLLEVTVWLNHLLN